MHKSVTMDSDLEQFYHGYNKYEFASQNCFYVHFSSVRNDLEHILSSIVNEFITKV
jgi:hypothetical protein